MKISLNWLKRYIDLETSAEALETVFPMIGMEVESVEHTGFPRMDKVVVGEVLKKEQHPEADRLSVCEVQVNEEGDTCNIVCGASNFKEGDRVPVALVGACLPGDFKIKKSKLRGVTSKGMMCSAKELGLGEDHAGLMILEDKPAIGTPIHEVFEDGDTIFDLEITANRGDCFSHIGIARELAAWYDLKVKYPEVKTKLPTENKPTNESLVQSIELATNNCPYYTAISIKNVKVGPSPRRLSESLESIGLRSVNNVVDVTNWVMMESGQPLHAFDAKKIHQGKIVVRQAKEGETLTTLDEKARTLDSSMMLIADPEKPLVVAGIMGSLAAEVDDSTVDIVLESAYFDPTSIRKTAKKLILSTDSSQRFSRDIDPQATLNAAFRAVDVLLEVAGGAVAGPAIVLGNPPRAEEPISIDPDFIPERCGFKVEKATIENLFRRIGYTILKDKELTWTVTVPSYRSEVNRPIDLVEEFLRMYGTENIPTAAPTFRGLERSDAPIAIYIKKASDYLVGQNFDECYNYIFQNEADLNNWHGEIQTKELTLDNPLTQEHSHLRASLIPGLCEVLRHNQAHNNTANRLYETGHVFRYEEGKIWELMSVAFVMRMGATEKQWLNRQTVDFYTAKNLLLQTAELAGISEKQVNFMPLYESTAWQEGHSAIAGKLLKQGFELQVGCVHLKRVKGLKINTPILAGELLIKPEYFNKKTTTKNFKNFSSYPASNKDISLVVDSSNLAEEIRSQVQKLAKQTVNGKFNVENVQLFDVYKGPGIHEGKKSLAFNIQYRAIDRTLSEQEVSQAFEGLQDKLKAETTYELRDA